MCSNCQTHDHAHSHTHTHHHGHAHSHDHSQVDFEKHNREWYDSNATKHINEKIFQDLSEQVSQALVKQGCFDKENTVVLDYACGPGAVTVLVTPHVKQVVGVDISQGSVDAFNSRAKELGFSQERMQAVRIDSNNVSDQLNGQTYDVVMCNLAYHHFESIDTITSTLASLVKPGGVLLVSDFSAPFNTMTDDHSLDNVVAHKHGFSESRILSLFESVGLTEVTYDDCIHIEVESYKMDVFIAKGFKPKN